MITSHRKEGSQTMKDTLLALLAGLLKLAIFSPVILILLILKGALTAMARILLPAGDHQSSACDHKFPAGDPQHPAGDPHGKQAGP